MNAINVEQIKYDARIKCAAQHAADNKLGFQANPYPEDSVAYVEWNQAYRTREKDNAIACRNRSTVNCD